MIPWASAAMSVWAWSAETLGEQDPGYVEAFWSQPGFAGHDRPGDFGADVVDCEVTVRKTLAAADVLADPRFAGTPGAMRAGFYPPDSVLAVELDGLRGNPLGSRVEIIDGGGAGRALYCNSVVNDALFADATGETGIARFSGVKPGDRIQLDNRGFLAVCHYHRHHVAHDEPGHASLLVDGVPMYPQRPAILASPFVGSAKAATYSGKMLWAQHTHDASVWPGAIVPYDRAVRAALGGEAEQRWCLRFTEHAENLPPMLIGGSGTNSAEARYVDWRGQVEQGLDDLVKWVEHGVQPAATNYRYENSQFALPATAFERGGIQPVVRLTANGGRRADVSQGEPVDLKVDAEVPNGQGFVIMVEWDPEGTGTWVAAEEAIDGTAARVGLHWRHAYAQPGTRIVGVRVTSNRTGNLRATFGQIVNLGRARVVVT